MKAEQLKLVIRQLIREELNSMLPELIPSILAEALTAKKQHDSPGIVQAAKPIVENKTIVPPVSKPVSKPIKKYTNNPLLNSIMNETVGGVVHDAPVVGLSSPLHASAANLNDIIKVDPVAAKQAEIGVLKDYSALMAVLDKKKPSTKSNAFSNLVSIDPTNTDYSTID